MAKINKHTKRIVKVMGRIDDATYKEGSFMAAVACCALLPTLADRMTRKEQKQLPMLLTMAREMTLNRTLDEAANA